MPQARGSPAGGSALRAAQASSVLWVTVIACAVLAAWFWKAAGRPLTHPDEGRYAEIAREMLVSGDWITPRLNGLKYFEKPPLQYWATAASYWTFGISEWTARLWTALTGLLCIGATWFVGTRLFSDRAGAFGALFLLASPYFVLAGSVSTLDMGVSAFLMVSVYAYLMSRSVRTGQRRWMMLAWASMALAVLSKGLIGVVLPAATLAIYALWQKDRACLSKLEWCRGALLFAALTLPWFVLVARANPEFLEFFFWHEHVARYASSVHRRTGPIWYFFPVLVFATGPWTFLVWRAVRGIRQQSEARGTFSARYFLLTWCLVVFTFFSLSQSKLPSYILPMVPALALLAGDAAARSDRRIAVWLALGTLVVSAAALIAAAHFERGPDQSLPARLEAFRFSLYVACVALIVLGAVVLRQWRRVTVGNAVATICLSVYLSLCLLEHHGEEMAARRTARQVATAIQSLDPSGAGTVYSVQSYDQTLPWYLGKTVVLVNYVDEFALGVRAEPERVIQALDAFMSQWQSEPGAFAVMPVELERELASNGMRMQRVLIQRDRVLIRSP